MNKATVAASGALALLGLVGGYMAYDRLSSPDLGPQLAPAVASARMVAPAAISDISTARAVVVNHQQVTVSAPLSASQVVAVAVPVAVASVAKVTPHNDTDVRATAQQRQVVAAAHVPTVSSTPLEVEVSQTIQDAAVAARPASTTVARGGTPSNRVAVIVIPDRPRRLN